jgi:putative hydrolase of the HAD superfamily
MIEKNSVQKYIQPLTPIPTSLTSIGNLDDDIRCLLFDIYGTLFISGSGDISLAEKSSPQLEAIEGLLAEYGIRKSPRDLLDEFHGAIKARHMELRSQGIDFPEVRIDRIWKQVLQMADEETTRTFAVKFELISNPVYPMPGLAEMLSSCRQRGLSMGIVSNAQFYTPCLFEWFLDGDLQSLGFNPELVFYSYQFEFAKPSATLFGLAAARLEEKGILPSSALYLGNDMLNDIYAAKNAGFKTGLFAGDNRSLRLRSEDPRCRDLKPDLVVTDLAQLIPHLG